MEISELLQIDATIIAGILILLTISSLKPEHNPKRSFLYFSKEQLTAVVVIPFGISAIQLLAKSVQPNTSNTTIEFIDIVLPIVGFCYLIIVIMALVKRVKIDATTQQKS